MISDFLLGIVYMAIVLVLVAPENDFSRVITDVSDSLANLVRAAITGSI